MTLQKITPHFWFDSNAEQAVQFYTSIFKNSAIGKTVRYTNEGQEIHHREAGTIMTIDFTLEGQRFIALNGGPEFKFNEALSLLIDCETQAEIDYYWEKLNQNADPRFQQCGWLKDQFGVSWQVNSTLLSEWLSDPDRQKASRTMKAMLQMKKLDIGVLQKAHDAAA